MDKNRKKELIGQYKQTRPQMGILIIRSRNGNKCCLQTTQNVNGAINGTPETDSQLIPSPFIAIC